MEGVLGAWGDDGGEEIVCLCRGGALRYESQPGRDTMYVRVDGEDGHTAREEKDYRSGLGTDAGKRGQLSHCRAGVEPADEIKGKGAVGPAQPGEDLLYALALLLGKTAGADDAGDCRRPGVKEVRPLGEAFSKSGKGTTTVNVGRILRQDGLNQNGEGVTVLLPGRCSETRPEDAVNALGFPLEVRDWAMRWIHERA